MGYILLWKVSCAPSATNCFRLARWIVPNAGLSPSAHGCTWGLVYGLAPKVTLTYNCLAERPTAFSLLGPGDDRVKLR
jgi:hypothetical protein